MGLQFNVSRVYIFEDSPDGLFMSNTFEWCNQGISPQIDNLQHMSYEEDAPGYRDNFDKDGIFLCMDCLLYTSEYEITSNRVDCYSVIGIAREAAATFRKTFTAPSVTKTGNDEDINDYLKVRVENSRLCPRYCARMVKNIRLAPSPRWMQRRLAASGIRPINNIVDITNYVMEEYGQPMHAFNYDQLAGHEIIVKCAKDGDVFQTLDGQERKLDSTILMINDGEKEVGIAGIMGGENSKITDDVTTMVFESACFDGTNIRLSAKKVGLRTDASGKYEKGLDPNTAEEAVNRACQLIEELGAGEVIGGIIDIYPVKKEEKRIPFDAARINRLLGTDIPEADMLEYFRMIELGYDADTKEVIAPTWRQDLERMADVYKRQALKICGITLVCLAIMFTVAAVNRSRGGEHLVAEYTVEDSLPRHVKFEKMPSDDAQLAAAWYFKYMGLAQFDRCARLFPQDQLESLNFNQEDLNFRDGRYIKEYIIHGFQTLSLIHI